MMDISLISSYVKASVHIYGVLHIQVLMELLKHYEHEKFTRKEIINHVSSICATCDDIELEKLYIYRGDIFSFSTALKNWKMHEQKPFWLPQRDEFLKFEDVSYYPKEVTHDTFFAYLKEEGWKGNEDDFREVIKKIQGDIEMNQIMEDFHCLGFMSEQKLKGFGDILVSVMNTTKRFNNHGFSPVELRNYKG